MKLFKIPKYKVVSNVVTFVGVLAVVMVNYYEGLIDGEKSSDEND